MLEGIRRIHFIGVGGIGMSALARILLDEGYEVSGSDVKRTPITDRLAELGATIHLGHRAENVSGVDMIVVSTAIADNNPEVVAARALGIKKLHRSDINASLLNAAKGIAVAGSHGKTTTTSMVGLVLEDARQDPTIIIGGEVDYLGGNAQLGHGEYLVSEADESDGSFVKLHPHIAVVTNIEGDHLDHYGSLENLQGSFLQFMRNVDEKSGYVIACADNANVRGLFKRMGDRRVVTYGIDQLSDYHATNIVAHGSQTEFDLVHEGETLSRIRLNVPGRHNVLNALAATVVGLLCDVNVEQIANALAKFHGAKRRFERKGEVDGITVIDDYAHHPTEIRATLAAARQTNPQRLVCAFQPHRYSRTQLLQRDFATAFADADALAITDIYSAGEAPIPGVSGKTIADAVAATGQSVKYIESRPQLAPYLATKAQPGDMVITMGAGDIWKTGEELLKLLQQHED